MTNRFEWSLSNIVAISQLAERVYATYKDAQGDFRHISEEIMPLQAIINMAVQHFERATFSDNDRQLGQEVLKGCHSILEDLNSLVEKLSSAIVCQGFNSIRLRVETLRARLISNTGSFNDFIQRFHILPTAM